MHLKYRNVNHAFREITAGIHSGRIPTTVMASRYGEVAVIEEPVIVTFEKPQERVLFNAARDANPFFHLYESLWMLAGRNDVAPLTYYCKRVPEFSDDGKTFNGAYGYRWRHAARDAEADWEVDQIKQLINHLRRKPESRRAVLQMWNVEDDLLKIEDSKDVCCNLSVCFSIEDAGGKRQDGKEASRYLNMTVFNRSNDLVWGLLGTNVVHFSILQEYLAAHLGLEVGVYNQVTNNLHVYTKTWQPEKWLADPQGYDDPGRDWYTTNAHGPLDLVPLVTNAVQFDRELPLFMELNKNGQALLEPRHWEEPFLQEVAQPMLDCYHSYKMRGATSLIRTSLIKADDWRIAAREWLERRLSKKQPVGAVEDHTEKDPDLEV